MYFIVIDLGGTITKIGLLHREVSLSFSTVISHLDVGFKNALEMLTSEINNLLYKSGIDKTDLSGIGLAFPGLVDCDKKRVISTNEKYNDAVSFNISKWVKDNWDVPFYIDNDARLATIGEWKYGAGVGYNDLVMMTIGTGIGTGVVLDGKALYGKHYQAGSLGGHFVVDYKGRDCTCGNKGCVEALASSFFLPNIIKDHPQVSLSFKAQAEQFDFKQIFTLAEKGDSDASLIRNECMEVWSAAFITLIHAYDPEVFIFGGGVLKSSATIIPYIEKRLEQYAWCPSGKVSIRVSALGDQAALYGLCFCLINEIKKDKIETEL